MKVLKKIQALKAKNGKPQHMKVGMVYEVDCDMAALLTQGGRAIEASESMEVGKVYDLPEVKQSNKELLGGGSGPKDSKKNKK